MLNTVKTQGGLGALKATGGGAIAATIATVPGLQAIIDAIAAAITLQLAKLFALAGVTAPAELGDFVKWLLVFVLLHQAIFWISNRWGGQPPAADSGSSGAPIGALLILALALPLLSACAAIPGWSAYKAAASGVVDQTIIERQDYNDKKAEVLVDLPCDMSLGAFARLQDSNPSKAGPIGDLCGVKFLPAPAPAP